MGTIQKEQSANSTVVDDRTDYWVVTRYGFANNKQEFQFRSLHDPIPDGATTVGPIYFISESQRNRYESLKEKPFATRNSNNIVSEIQTECEQADHVLYPLYVESDALGATDGDGNFVDHERMLSWIRKFIDQVLGVDLEECTFYFTGGRSIHAHVSRFVSHSHLPVLRSRAKSFNEKYGVDLDEGIYSSKRQFRLPGVPHKTTGVPKVNIPGQVTNAEIARIVNTAKPAPPTTFADVLTDVFGFVPPEMVTIGSSGPFLTDAIEDFGGSDYLFKFPRHSVGLTASERAFPRSTADEDLWNAYNRDHFSPYANAGEGNPRSVAAVEVLRGPFCRTSNKLALVPCYIWGAVSCDGKFTVQQEYRPLKISEKDRKKWDYEPGSVLVVIGGRNREAKIIEVPLETAKMVAFLLTFLESGRRQSALDLLREDGYDTGTEGTSTTASGRSLSARKGRLTRAQRLQRQAERDGIYTLTHDQCVAVAMRLLRVRGWDGTWEWHKSIYDTEHKPDVLYDNLSGLARSMNNNGANITIPPRSQYV